MQIDQAGHGYAEAGNVRVTFVPRSDRAPTKDWAGADVIRIQAYKGDGSKALYPGAEFPVPNAESFADLVRAMCLAYYQGIHR